MPLRCPLVAQVAQVLLQFGLGDAGGNDQVYCRPSLALGTQVKRFPTVAGSDDEDVPAEDVES